MTKKKAKYLYLNDIYIYQLICLSNALEIEVFPFPFDPMHAEEGQENILRKVYTLSY